MEEVKKEVSYIDVIDKVNYYGFDIVEAIIPTGVHKLVHRLKNSTVIIAGVCTQKEKMMTAIDEVMNVSFVDCYTHNGKIPEDCIVIDNMLLHIDQHVSVTKYTGSITAMKIIDEPLPKSRGTDLFIDGILYKKDVPLLKKDKIIKEILKMRASLKLWFNQLEVIDLSGNHTIYEASPACRNKHLNAWLHSRVEIVTNTGEIVQGKLLAFQVDHSSVLLHHKDMENVNEDGEHPMVSHKFTYIKIKHLE